MENNEKEEQKTEEKNTEKKKTGKKIRYIAPVIIIIVIIAAGFLLMRPSYNLQRQYAEHFLGAENASVTIVEYSDFQCPSCRQVYPIVEQVISEYGNRIKFVYKHFPLTTIHQYAQKCAEAAECAYDISGEAKFWEYYNKIYTGVSLSDSALKGYAGDIGINQEQFALCLDSGAMVSRVSSNKEEGQARGITGTPTFFINDQSYPGSRPFTEFKQIIDSKLV